jgi:membrane protease YdiL (CAAX protease family)
VRELPYVVLVLLVAGIVFWGIIAHREPFPREAPDVHPELHSSGALTVNTWLLLLQVVMGLGVAAGLLACRAQGHRLVPAASLLPGRWTLWDVVKAVAVFVALSAGANVVRWSGVLSGGEPPPVTIRDVCLLSGVEALSVVFACSMVQQRHGEWLKPLGLTRTDFAVNVLRGVVGYVAVFPACALSTYAMWLLAQRYGWRLSYNTAIRVVLDTDSPGSLALLMVLIALAAPVLEEIAFRGFLYGALRRILPAWPAIAVTSVAFAMLHPAWSDWAAVFVLAVAMGYLRERTASLVPCIAMHCSLNSLTLLRLLLIR